MNQTLMTRMGLSFIFVFVSVAGAGCSNNVRNAKCGIALAGCDGIQVALENPVVLELPSQHAYKQHWSEPTVVQVLREDQSLWLVGSALSAPLQVHEDILTTFQIDPQDYLLLYFDARENMILSDLKAENYVLLPTQSP